MRRLGSQLVNIVIMAEEEEAKKEPALSDEVMRKLLKPVPAHSDILKILEACYVPSSPSASCRVLRQLDSYDDCNFQVEIDGKPYLFKVHNGVESRDFLRCYEAAGRDYYKKGHASSVIHLQVAMIERLAKSGIPTSAVVRPCNGSAAGPVVIATLPVTSADHSPTPLVVKLMEWLPGRPMSSVKLVAAGRLGRCGTRPRSRGCRLGPAVGARGW